MHLRQNLKRKELCLAPQVARLLVAVTAIVNVKVAVDRLGRLSQ